MPRPWALVPLLVLVLAPPFAAAQGPPPLCGPLDHTISTSPAVPVGGVTTVTLVIHNANENRGIDVHVVANIASDGWTLSDGGEKKATLNAKGAAGSSVSFTYNLTASPGAATPGVLNLNYSGVCALHPDLPCPEPSACETQPKAVTVNVALVRSEGLGIPGLENLDIAPEYLVGGLVLLGLAALVPFALHRRPRGGVRAAAPEPLKLVRAGRGTSFPIELRNPGSGDVTATFEVSPVPEGWSAFVPVQDVQLAPREARNLFLMVRAPAEAEPGEAVDVELHVREVGAPDRALTLLLRAEIAPEPGRD